MILEDGSRLHYSQVAWRRVRKAVLARDDHQCVLCAAQGRVEAARAVDHVTPLFQGGAALDPENLQSLCLECHRIKTAEEHEPIRRRGCDVNGEPYSLKNAGKPRYLGGRAVE